MSRSFNWDTETDRCRISATHITRIVDLDRQAFEPKIIFPAATGEVMQKKTANLNNILIDTNNNKNVNDVLKNFIFKKNNLQNRVYLKNLLNRAVKSYAG